MPLVSTYTNYTVQPVINPADARIDAGIFAASTTLAAGTVLGKITSGGKLAAYASGNSDGTQVAVGILAVDIVTDSSSKVFFGTGSAVAAYEVVGLDTAPYYTCGTFDTADLTGWDATALSTLKARTLADGYVKIP